MYIICVDLSYTLVYIIYVDVYNILKSMSYTLHITTVLKKFGHVSTFIAACTASPRFITSSLFTLLDVWCMAQQALIEIYNFITAINAYFV